MYHPYLSEQLSGEKETEFQSRGDQARRTRKTGRRISGFITAVLVLGMLAGACGAGPVAEDGGATAGQTVQVANREAMLNQVIDDLIRYNGPYLETAAVAEAASLPAGFIEANGPYIEPDTTNVPANVR